MEIAAGVHLLKVPIPNNPLGNLNCYLLRGQRGWLMIDTGWNTEVAFNALEDQIKAIGLSFKDITHIVVTHVHPDHYGLAGRLKRLSPARLALHHWETALIETRYVHYVDLQKRVNKFLARYGVPEEQRQWMETASQPVLDFVTVAWPDEVLYGVERFDIEPFHLQVLWTPGHSPGHVCLYDAGKRLLFSGDHVLPTITPNISYHLQSGTNPLGDYLNSLRMLRRLQVDMVLPAHEEVFHDLKARIAEITEHHVQRAATITDIIQREPLNAYQIAARVSWNVPGRFEDFPVLHKRSAVMEVLAHLEALWIAGRVDKVFDDDRVRYRASVEGRAEEGE